MIKHFLPLFILVAASLTSQAYADDTIIADILDGQLTLDEGEPCTDDAGNEIKRQCARRGKCPDILQDGVKKKQLCMTVVDSEIWCGCFVPGYPYPDQTKR
jgi:hypothetical protein